METEKTHESVFTKWINQSSYLGGVIAAVCLMTLAIIITYEAIMRYLFNAPTTWVKEISICLSIAIGFLGAAYCLKQDGHFSITIVVDKLKPKNKKALKILTNLMGLLYSIIFVYKGIEMVKFSYDMEDVSSGLLEFPLWIPELLLPCGGLLLALQFVNKLNGEFSSPAE